MDKQRIIFEASPGYILLCILGAVAVAYLLYKRKNNPWNRVTNWILFCFRTFFVFVLTFLLLGPIVRQVTNTIEKPLFFIMYDHSGSVKEVMDSTQLNAVIAKTKNLTSSLADQGYEVVVTDLEGKEFSDLQFDGVSTDIQKGLKSISAKHEGRKLSGLLLLSDGIYNAGTSPLYSTYNFPVHTIGVGDTSQRVDVSIKNIAYNKIAYQGNRFPIRVEILLSGISNQNLQVSLLKSGQIVEQQTKNMEDRSLLAYEFFPEAKETGIQRYSIQAEVKDEEFNKRNNQETFFVEVIEGRKQVLLISPAPHPDIKALRSVVEANHNFSFSIQIPGMISDGGNELEPDEVDLVIFHQSPDLRGKTKSLFQKYMHSRTSMLLIFGKNTDFNYLRTLDLPFQVTVPRDYDEVTPVMNSTFSLFGVEEDVGQVFSHYPPISIPFNNIDIPLTSSRVLTQRIGSLVTDKPLLSISEIDNRKLGVLLGDGIWRWRLSEYDRTESFDSFDEVFGKLVQYLSTVDEKKRFKSFPIQQEFSEVEPVIIESQVYNDIYEPVYGNTINIEVTGDQGKSSYAYVLGPGNVRYQIGGLDEGVYKFRSSTNIKGRRESIEGQFVVKAKMAEIQNLTADFDLLRKLSDQTGGNFYTPQTMEKLQNDLLQRQATGVIHSEESFESIINLKWIFWLLIAFVTIEWTLRKYFGGY